MAEVLGQRERSGVPTGGDALEIVQTNAVKNINSLVEVELVRVCGLRDVDVHDTSTLHDGHVQFWPCYNGLMCSVGSVLGLYRTPT